MTQERLTLSDYINATYNRLFQDGWRMNDIDSMDFIGYLKIRCWEAKRKHKRMEPKRVFIDQCGLFDRSR